MKLPALPAGTLLALVLANSAQATNDDWSFSFLLENDLFADSDQNYTNGIQLGAISPDLTEYRDSDKLPKWSLPLIQMLPFINEDGLQRNIGFSLGQKKLPRKTS
jgi:lipid A 3-O-deacylase